MNFAPFLSTCSTLSLSDLQQKKALRMSMPERVLLTWGHEERAWEAELSSVAFEEKEVCLQLLSRPMSKEVLRLAEAPQAKWRIQSPSAGDFQHGMLVDIFDTTPSSPPTGLELDEESQSTLLRASDRGGGSLTYNGMGGLAPAECPREMDSIDIAFTIWSCKGATSCKVQDEGEDDFALVCEFGPEGLKKGIKSMVPGERRRFWISADEADRRFGRPAPDRFLPAGEVVVDIELRSIQREGVFEFTSSPESLELARRRDESLPVLTKRAFGVGIQILPLLWFLKQSGQDEGKEIDANLYRLVGGGLDPTS
eukprot:CAMPEP_0197709548 /NCGR_PEP_ID=MMETSP1338-20131121/128512_1 /TAXON_ID=43686 ORGANISM="Pelagodinium beii, Strain RCC1491" /NCGR_SAMPLE_ID=MMETSP1338 /ASSEMBLY_ACC=CAM_ASM_000754 /LENGTH=310 /DNA_ID=CAMNT_0043293483 /DNA_START=149 /DNA_END=1081 /DNA_ORIENTATION=+